MATKSKRIKGNDYCVEDYNITLQRHGIQLSTKLKLIFDKLEFHDLRSISMIDSVLSLEQSVKKFLGCDVIYPTMSEDEKKALFGQHFWNRPQDFHFLPGENNTIRASIDVAKKIINKRDEREFSDENFHSDSTSSRKKVNQSTFRVPLTTIQSQPNPRPNQSNPDANAIPNRGGKTLQNYVSNWLDTQDGKGTIDY